MCTRRLFPVVAAVLLHSLLAQPMPARAVDLVPALLEEAPDLAPPGRQSGSRSSSRIAAGDTTWIADWSFDSPTGCDPSGWTHYDNRILNDGSNYWSLLSSFGGTGGITGQAAVLRKHDLSWARDGYGNSWDYSIILQYSGPSPTLSFDFLSDSEPSYDFFTVEADSAGASEARVNYAIDPTATPVEFRQVLLIYTGPQAAASVTALALPTFGVVSTTHEVYLRFDSDGGYSDEDGLYTSVWNAGLVIDNIGVTGDIAYGEEFEAALDPHVTLANTAPATPFGDWARLWQHPTDNDNCSENTTCAWIFSDPTLPASSPEMAFGPGGYVVRNWLDNIIVSPWVSLSTTSDAAVTLLSYRVFQGQNYSASKIVRGWRVRSRVRIDNTDTPTPGDSIDVATPWVHTSSFTNSGSFSWITSVNDMTSYLVAGAREIQVSIRVSDWQYITGAAPPTTLNPGPGPYIDRLRIGRRGLTGPTISLIPSFGTIQDGFPSARNAIAPGENYSPTTDGFGTVDVAPPFVTITGGTVGLPNNYNTADSLTVTVLDVRQTGSVSVSLWAAIVAGPHTGKAPPPYTVAGNGFFQAPAQPCPGYSQLYFLDLDDEYFRGGDTVVYFWAATDGAGGFTSMPGGLTAPPLSISQAQAATGGLYEVNFLPRIDWDPGYLARVAADPSGKVAPTPEEIANSSQSACLLYLWQRPWARQYGPTHRTTFMATLDQLGYHDVYDAYFVTLYFANYLAHLGGRASVEQAAGYSLIIHDAQRYTFSILPPHDHRDRPVDQVQWYRDWLAQAPLSVAQRATLWILGDQLVAGEEGSNPLVLEDMGVAVASNPQTLLPYPEIAGQGTFAWAAGDSTDFTGDRLTLDSGGCWNRYNTGLAATGTAAVTHRYTLGSTTGDGATVMNANPALGWNTIMMSFSWEDLYDPPGSLPGDAKANWVEKLLAATLPESCGALANPTDTPDRTAALPRASRLYQNVPNPFNPVTRIVFDLHRDGTVQLQVFDVSGRHVATLVDGPMTADWRHTVTWNGLDDSGRPVGSGVYLYRLVTADLTTARKLVVVR